MLKRKITTYIETHLTSNSDKILLIEGARQVGKSYAIREAGKRLFDNYVEINFVTDNESEQLFGRMAARRYPTTMGWSHCRTYCGDIV